MRPSGQVIAAASLSAIAVFLAGLLTGTAIGPGARGGREGPAGAGAGTGAGGRSGPGGASGATSPTGGRGVGLAGGAAGGRSGAGGETGAARAGGASGGARAGGAAGAHDRHDHGDSLEGAPEGEAGATAGPSLSLDEALARLAADPSPAFAERYAAELRRDRRAMEAALARLRSETDPARLDALAYLLAQARTPEVEALAGELALRGDRAHRVAALGLLDQFETPAAMAPAAETLRSERDAALLAAAVYALPEPRGVAAQESAPVVEGLRRALASPDAEVRRRALVALASWLPASEAEPLLAQALERDGEASVRAGAAYGLEMVRPRLESTVTLLASVMVRRAEERLVRENAWRALGSVGPLTPELAALWRAFAEEMEAREN